jgi:two-component sensor histidine kinase
MLNTGFIAPTRASFVGYRAVSIDHNGTPIKMFGVMQDITDRKNTQARQEMLTHELEHRIKNILAMVLAIASQTLRNTDVDAARRAFDARLRALSRAHDILNSTRWTNASVHQVTKSSISAFPVGRTTFSGPVVQVTPRMALTLALVINELGTNAQKYGAFAVPTGTVAIEWPLQQSASCQNSTFIWAWREIGGPPVQPPTRRGFGRMLVERVFGADFGGTVRIEYRPQGVECVLTAPFPFLVPAAN